MERRTSHRFSIQSTQGVEASLILEGNSLLDRGQFSTVEIPVVPTDLSLGGIGLSFSFVVDLSDISFHDCTLVLKKEGSFEIPAQLAHFDHEAGRMGLAFKRLDAANASFIQSLLENQG
ncbi:MAG: hypothetical protein HYS22_08250 [Deltaproteobacteria bacterium]|nr:hypothetical protein [Deltaproteobacteria bacterium]